VKLKNHTTLHFFLFSLLVLVIGIIKWISDSPSAIDIQLHDTYYVIPPYHIFLGISIILGIIATLYYLVPKLLNTSLNVTLSKTHFWLTFICMLIIIPSLGILGMGGVPRRYYRFDTGSFDIFQHFGSISLLLTVFTFIFLVTQLIPIFNLFYSLKNRKVETQNNSRLE